jgi:hypothetical protein
VKVFKNTYKNTSIFWLMSGVDEDGLEAFAAV